MKRELKTKFPKKYLGLSAECDTMNLTLLSLQFIIKGKIMIINSKSLAKNIRL